MKNCSQIFVFSLALLLGACTPNLGRVNPADTSARADQIHQDIAYLASDALEGRLTGTPGNDSAAAYIARRYAALRLASPFAGYLQSFDALSAEDAHLGRTIPRHSQNVVAMIPGSDPRLRGEYVVIGAHYDHL